MQKLVAFTLLILLTSCASFQNKNKKSQNIDGIIFLDEDEEKTEKKTESSSRNSDGNTQVDNKQKQSEELRNLNDMDGIIFLNIDDQIAEVPGKPFTPSNKKFEIGKASFYAMKFKGRKTASGEVYDPDKFTAAHPSLPFGTKVLVTNLYNSASVVVRINDRGPHVKSRIIDLSYAAAQELGIIKKGVAEVTLEVIQNP